MDFYAKILCCGIFHYMIFRAGRILRLDAQMNYLKKAAACCRTLQKAPKDQKNCRIYSFATETFFAFKEKI